MKHILFAALLLTAVPPAHAQLTPYISPGLQIGYGSGQGLFFSVQVSVGIILNIPLVPAVTIGIRQYKGQTMRYADVQLTLFTDYAAGIGFGGVWVTPGDTPEEGPGTIAGLRLKLYGGFLLLGSYDAYKLPGHPVEYHLGSFLVVPVVRPGFFSIPLGSF